MNPSRVIVTAGASGIGRAIVGRFRAAGARVAVCDVDARLLSQLAAADPEIFTKVVDVADEGAVQDFVGEVKRAFGGVDALINNAGVAGACAMFGAIDAAAWRRCFDVNVNGAFYAMKAVEPLMRAQNAGAIVNISTGSVFTLPAGRADYIASKWALEGLTRAAARELGPAGIRVNAIRPGFVDSDRMRGILAAKALAEGTSPEDLTATFLKYISMRAKVQPEEIGDMAVFLTSSAARHVTGQLVSVDGNIEWEE
jgi:NAD(P)-dependent dehydrogenase (short-subunit alcohol dehydrogenase family)